MWWLAQAPGPVGLQSNIQTIHDQDVSILSSSDDWTDTWKGVLVPLGGPSASTIAPNPASSSNPINLSHKLSPRSKAGIGASIAVCGLVVISLCAFFYRTKHDRKGETPLGGTLASTTLSIGGAGSLQNTRCGGHGAAELCGHEIKIENLHELEGDIYK